MKIYGDKENRKRKIHMKITPKNIFNHYCIYLLYIDQTPVYCGRCKLSNVYETPDARKIAAFDREASYSLSVVRVYQNKTEMLSDHSFYKTLAIYPLNRIAHQKEYTVILCEQTRQIFRTVNECARHQGIYASTLCNHLNNRAGFKTINNCTYKRIACTDPAILARLRAGQVLSLDDMQPKTITTTPQTPAMLPIFKA
jgi:hypothetical protein